MQVSAQRKPKILVINPNSTAAMSDSLRTMLANRRDLSEKYDITVTQPNAGPSSINNDDDAADSLPHCISLLTSAKYLSSNNAFLVACYSDHPLVPWLRQQLAGTGQPVLGIFEASVAKSLRLLREGQQYGIVSTGNGWKALLTAAVQRLGPAVGGQNIGQGLEQSRFAGVETTGLNATELHDAPWEQVRQRMKDATRRLARAGSIGAICLGCAGMAGMDETVREALQEELGHGAGDNVAIVDGVLAGVEILGEQLGYV